MVGSKSPITALASLLVFISACATPLAERFSCSNSDWYEIGRRDGASGASAERLDKYREKCGDRLEVESADMYRNGRNAGLVEYCTSRNGYELGRMRVKYNSVCPHVAEKEFLQAYERGSRTRILEQENKNLDTRIEQLAKELGTRRSVATEGDDSIAKELAALKGKRAEIDQELTRISK